MNDCSDFGEGNCFDDKRTDLRTEDAFAWFLNRYKKGIEISDDLKTDPYDVIIMDALDPEDTVEFAKHLYKDLTFWGTLHEPLNEKGMLVMQLGMSPSVNDAAEYYSGNHNRAMLFNTIEIIGFQKMFLYQEFHSDFQDPWSYLVAYKSEQYAKEWFHNEAEINVRIRERLLETKSGMPVLKYVDGSTIQEYQRPSIAWDTVYCRKDPYPLECSAFHGQKNMLLGRNIFHMILEDGKKKLPSKMNMTEGSVIIPSKRFGKLKSNFSSLKTKINLLEDGANLVSSLAGCGVVRPLIDMDFVGKINPLLDRHPESKHMLVLTKDIFEDEKLSC
mmetsp:Transcript_36574/g.41724  ORF Transcript_36574/g.41724 Transcript_36574/m.41724 type:complete len:331 (-) Transcript_36574:40-1032(-)